MLIRASCGGRLPATNTNGEHFTCRAREALAMQARGSGTQALTVTGRLRFALPERATLRFLRNAVSKIAREPVVRDRRALPALLDANLNRTVQHSPNVN